MNAAANSQISLEHGDERFLLPLNCDTNVRKYATLTALRMPKVSSAFPTWPLAEAWDLIQQTYQADNQVPAMHLPTVPAEIAGTDVDLMVGIQYKRYFPKLIYSLPGGLSIYSAIFKGCDGHQGVLGGPSPLWRELANSSHFMEPAAYLLSELRAYVHTV